MSKIILILISFVFSASSYAESLLKEVSATSLGEYKLVKVSLDKPTGNYSLTVSDIARSSCGKTPGAYLDSESLSENVSTVNIVGMTITQDCPVRQLPDGTVEAYPVIEYERAGQMEFTATGSEVYFLIPAHANYFVEKR